MHSTGVRLPYHSRFQVLTDGEPAWATDHKGILYRFDGLYFSRSRRRDGSFCLIPSWQTPSYGWLRPSECPCTVLLTKKASFLRVPSRTSPDIAA